MDRTSLLAKLQELRITALESHRLTEIGRRHLYLTLARIYFVHREFTQADSKYLDQLYNQAGIVTTGGQSNEVNYRPFLRLVWDQTVVDGAMNNRLTHWSKVLRQLDARYLENPGYFAEIDREQRMASYIDECGGVTAMVERANGVVGAPEFKQDVVKTKPSEARKIVERQKVAEVVAERHIQLLSSTSAPAIATVAPTATMRHDGNKLVALIGRLEADGTVKLLGSTNDTDAINMVAARALNNDLRFVSPALRQLLEIISLSRFPQVAKPKGQAQQRAWRDRIFYDQGKGKKDEPMTSPRRLLLRGKSGDMLLSCMRRERSVVVICEPSHKLAPKGQNIYLQTALRSHLEDALADGSMELMSSQPETSLEAVQGKAHTHVLHTQNATLGKTRALYFYEQGRKQDNADNNWQADFSVAQFKPDWTAKVDSAWLSALRAGFLDKWFATLGKSKQIKRENNYTFQLSAAAKALTLRYNMDDSGVAPEHAMPVAISFPDSRKKRDVVVRSKDLAPVLYNLADLVIKDGVEISGNADAIVFKFATSMGRYVVAVPTVHANGASASILFKKEH